MKTYRVGVIGVGGVSRLHTDAYMALPNIELVAAADVSEEALAGFTKKYEITNVYKNYRSMLEQEKLDIVAIFALDSHGHRRHHCWAGVLGQRQDFPLNVPEHPLQNGE